MSYTETKRCVNDRHDVPALFAGARTCMHCEEERDTRIMVAVLAPVLAVLAVAFAVMLYASIGWWVAAVVVAVFLLVRHRRGVVDGLDRFGGWLLRLMGVSS